MTEMKNYCLILYIVCCGLSSCQMSMADQKDDKIDWSLDLARNKIADIYKRGGVQIFTGEELLREIPASWNAFSIKEESGKTFKGANFHFSEAYRVFENRASYLDVRLADYAADSSAWLNILSRYLDSKQRNETRQERIVPSPENQVFAWIWTDAITGITHLESGGYFRFHMTLRTNLPEGKKVLDGFFREFNWRSLATDARKLH